MGDEVTVTIPHRMGCATEENVAAMCERIFDSGPIVSVADALAEFMKGPASHWAPEARWEAITMAGEWLRKRRS